MRRWMWARDLDGREKTKNEWRNTGTQIKCKWRCEKADNFIYISICNNCIISFHFGSHRLSAPFINNLYNKHYQIHIYHWLDRWFRNQISVNRKFYFDGGISQMAVNGVCMCLPEGEGDEIEQPEKDIQVTSINLHLSLSFFSRFTSVHFIVQCGRRPNSFDATKLRKRDQYLQLLFIHLMII